MMARKFLKLLLTALVAGAPAVASPLDDALETRVLPGWNLPDGARMAALHLRLAPGWKTYWRVPGDAGIPPRFNWRRAKNIAAIDVRWPKPDVFYEYGMRSLGYAGDLVLPLRIAPRDPGAPIRLRGRIEIGLCSDICVPFSFSIDETLPEAGTTPTPEIVAALAATPLNGQEAQVRTSVCRISPIADGMRIEAQVTLPHTGGQEVAVIEPGLPDVWASEPVSKRRGDTLSATSDLIHVEGTPFSVDRSDVRITIIGSSYAVDVRGCTGG